MSYSFTKTGINFLVGCQNCIHDGIAKTVKLQHPQPQNKRRGGSLYHWPLASELLEMGPGAAHCGIRENLIVSMHMQLYGLVLCIIYIHAMLYHAVSKSKSFLKRSFSFPLAPRNLTYRTVAGGFAEMAPEIEFCMADHCVACTCVNF